MIETLGILVLANASAMAQTPLGSAWRTAYGKPDLQGVWSNLNNVPLERPKQLGAKEFYTKEEAAKIAKQGFRGDAAPIPAAHYDLSQFGLDASQGLMAPNLRTSLIVGPEGTIPPFTPEARERLASLAAKAKGHEFDGPENRPLGERCIIWPKEGPPMVSSAYNNDLQIIQAPGYVAILQEMIHDVRIIPLDGRSHLPSNVRQWMGDSRGHWEGNTLVVDTTNFTDKTSFHGSTAGLHVVERFTRTNENTIRYEFTVEDPATWVKPWSAQLEMVKTKGPIFEYACQEGNYGMANTLKEARETEAAAAKAGSK
jgi:hypothetical protein